MKPIIYISGRVSGMEEEAYILFERAENMLREKGYEVINPMKLDHNHDKEWESYMRIDLAKLMTCQAVYFLNHWILSRGARLEYMNSFELGLQLIFEADRPVIPRTKKPKFQFQIDYKELMKEDFMQPLLTSSRAEKIAIPRQYIMFLLSEETRLTHEAIGGLFNRDHSTISHAKKTIKNAIEVKDSKTLAYIDIIKKHLFIAGYVKEMKDKSNSTVIHTQ